MCNIFRSLFVFLYFFSCPLCCLFFFDIRILITPLISSNSSYVIKCTEEWYDTINIMRWNITLIKCPCIKLFITYFQHLEKRHPYWPETKSRPILARAIWVSIWKWSCSFQKPVIFPGCENMDSLLPVILVIQKCLYLN